jgi:hypothetical protein
VTRGVEPKGPDAAAARRLLAKIRTFVADQLDEDEAALFAALVAPGVARAYQNDEDVQGFGSDVDWRPGALPDSLAEAVREGGIRVVGLSDE